MPWDCLSLPSMNYLAGPSPRPHRAIRNEDPEAK
uniref:Uncharacterized protein n=1 Tax=Triticum urartu TaxID=4572 RepID=A0A8R7TSK2_TRIUA